MNSFGVAVAGTGFIGPLHVEALRRANQTVVGIMGSSPEKSRAAADALGIPSAYSSFDELLRDPRVDAVHITTPNRLHFQMAAAALQAGKHVLCEKPLAMNSRESKELVSLAAKSKVAAAVAYNIRFYPLCLEVRERIQTAGPNSVLHVAGSYVQDWLLFDTDFNWRVLGAEGGKLRALADIGTHWLDLVQFITGLKITSLCADLKTVHQTRRRAKGSVQTFSSAVADPVAYEPIPIDTEDAGGVLFEFENGARGNLWVSQTTAGRKNCLRFEIGCQTESFAWNSELPNELWIGRRDRPNELLLRDPSLLSPAAAAFANYPGGHNEGFPDSFKQLFRAFYDDIAAGDFDAPGPLPSFTDGHREIEICESILLSNDQRRWVEIGKWDPPF